MDDGTVSLIIAVITLGVFVDICALVNILKKRKDDEPQGGFIVKPGCEARVNQKRVNDPEHVYDSRICPVCGKRMTVVVEPLFYTETKALLCDEYCRLYMEVWSDSSVHASKKASKEAWKDLMARVDRNNMTDLDRVRSDYHKVD